MFLVKINVVGLVQHGTVASIMASLGIIDDTGPIQNGYMKGGSSANGLTTIDLDFNGIAYAGSDNFVDSLA